MPPRASTPSNATFPPQSNVGESAPPLYVAIKNALRDQILAGTYQPLERIPSESELIQQFQVSRITVNRALTDLENEGLIFRMHGKGSFVSKPKPTQDLSNLQGFGEAMAPQGFEIFNRVLIAQEVNVPTDVAKELRLSSKQRVIEISRVRHLNRQPVSLDLFYIQTDLGTRLKGEDLATRDLFSILENDCGIELGYAEVRIEATLVTAAEAKLLDIDPSCPCLEIERTTFTAANTPLCFDRVLCRADKFRYQIRTPRAKHRTSIASV
jgi:GntR family transcriptional regulator